MDDPFTSQFDKGYDKKTGFGLIQADKAANALLMMVGIDRLTPYAICSENPDYSRKWIIKNPNSFAVTVRWELTGTSQRDTFLAVPGDNYLTTKTNSFFNILSMAYDSPYGYPVIRMAYSPGYRCNKLKSTDTDILLTEEEPTLVLGTYPNPFVSNLNLDLYNGSACAVMIKIYNTQGVEVYNQSIDPTHGYSSTELNLADLQKGAYIMKVSTLDGKLNESVKLFKQ